jgi:hypothetical protein
VTNPYEIIDAEETIISDYYFSICDPEDLSKSIIGLIEVFKNC